MRLITFFVFAALLTKACLAEITIASPKADPYSDLDDAAINILTQCYQNRTAAIGFAGNSSDYLLKTILARNLIDVTLIGESRMMSNAVFRRRSMIQQRLAIFVFTYEHQSIEDEFVEHFLDTIRSFTKSIWWNQLASYILILKAGSGCQWYHGHFWAFWMVSIINAKIICIDYRVVPSKIRLLTYNPYVDLAPKPWKLFGTFKFEGKSLRLYQKIFMYRQEYQNDETVCNQLDFDKTQNLGGQIIIIDQNLISEKDLTERRYEKSSQVMSALEGCHIMHLIFKIMNARTVAIPFDRNYYHRRIRPVVELYRGTVALQNSIGLSRSYPVTFCGGILMSNFRGHKTQLEKILGVVDKTSQVATCITLVITMIFLKLFVNQAFVPAFLNTVRIVCNAGFMNLRKNTATRIFIGSVLSFVVTMQGIFQGDLASLLTTQVAYPNINTIQDVVNFGSNVYSVYANSPTFPRLNGFKGQIVKIRNNWDCYLHLVNDTMAVCFGIRGSFIDNAIKHKLHVSDQEFGHVYLVNLMDENWPLELRVNNIIRRIFEADIGKPLIVRAYEKPLKEFQDDDEVKANKDFSVMKLKHLRFAFVILGIGLACTTVVFIGEIVIYRVSSRVRSTRVQYFNKSFFGAAVRKIRMVGNRLKG